MKILTITVILTVATLLEYFTIITSGDIALGIAAYLYAEFLFTDN